MFGYFCLCYNVPIFLVYYCSCCVLDIFFVPITPPVAFLFTSHKSDTLIYSQKDGSCNALFFLGHL